MGSWPKRYLSFRCELIIAWLSFLLLSRERLFVGGCGLWLVSLVAAVRLSAARRALCSGALVPAVKRPCPRFDLFSGRPLRTPSRVAFLSVGRSQYNNLWPRVAIKTKCEISIHSYRCRQSELYRPSLSDRRRFATYDFAHTEWAELASTRNYVLCL